MESEGGGNFKTKKIFVGGLQPTLTEDGFRQYFESYGHVKPALPKYANSGGGSRQGYGSSTDQQQQTDGRKTNLKIVYQYSVSPPDLEEQYKYFFNWPPSSSDVEPEEIADPKPEEMPCCDWLLEEKDHRMRLDQRIVYSERMVMELSLEMEAEMADRRRRMKLEAEMADLEDQPPWKDEEPNWSPINFMLKEDLSP
ncbi:hypothetical protein Q3G72_019783 [Acer saccharum]|nr:hypothetical protein Q3G72_019783 [Acer saccharum]